MKLCFREGEVVHLVTDRKVGIERATVPHENHREEGGVWRECPEIVEINYEMLSLGHSTISTRWSMATLMGIVLHTL